MNQGTASGTDAVEQRRAAVMLLRAVLRQRRPLEDAMGHVGEFAQLAGNDRAFAGHMVRTALRRLGQIDSLIDACLDRPLPRKAADVRDILRVGIVQLLFSTTAPYAAVTTAVELCRAMNQSAFAKLVNAVLRRLQREGEAMVGAQDAERLNTPGWLWDTWVAAYGETAVRAIARQHLEVPPLDLTPKDDVQGWTETLGGVTVLGGTVRLNDPMAVPSLAGFDAGAWWVQDAAARLPVALLGDLAGKTVFDLCAAPGGKTMELAAMGARVTSLDISEKRLQRVRENLSRTGLDAELVAVDARKWTPPHQAELVILDAPCSATGTMRRHPEVAHLKSAEDVVKLAAVQDALLDAAAEMVVPGGTILYATCSLQPEEGPDRVAAFLARQPAFGRNALARDAVPGLADAITSAGDLRTLPCYLSAAGGMDGFFAARLTRDRT